MPRLYKLLVLFTLLLGLLVTSLVGVGFERRVDLTTRSSNFTHQTIRVEPPPAAAADAAPLRVVTYNVHAGLGPHWWRFRAPRAVVERNLRQIARNIADAAPRATPMDVIGLNEVDFASRRSGWLDQAKFLADELERLTGHHYGIARAETWNRSLWGIEVRFGNAALVRHPIRAVAACTLEGSCAAKPTADTQVHPVATSTHRIFGAEPRGVLRVTVDAHGRSLDVLVTHLEAFARERRERQAAELTQHLIRQGRTTILLGDFNAEGANVPGGRALPVSDRTHAILAGVLLDARLVLAARQRLPDLSPWATYPATAPTQALDAIFASSDLWPTVSTTIGHSESDHRGLVVQYSWLTQEATQAHGLWYAVLRRQQQ